MEPGDGPSDVEPEPGSRRIGVEPREAIKDHIGLTWIQPGSGVDHFETSSRSVAGCTDRNPATWRRVRQRIPDHVHHCLGESISVGHHLQSGRTFNRQVDTLHLVLRAESLTDGRGDVVQIDRLAIQLECALLRL